MTVSSLRRTERGLVSTVVRCTRFAKELNVVIFSTCGVGDYGRGVRGEGGVAVICAGRCRATSDCVRGFVKSLSGCSSMGITAGSCTRRRVMLNGNTDEVASERLGLSLRGTGSGVERGGADIRGGVRQG